MKMKKGKMEWDFLENYSKSLKSFKNLMTHTQIYAVEISKQLKQ